jgi:hypothetical protein
MTPDFEPSRRPSAKLQHQPDYRNPLGFMENDALTVKTSTERRVPKWLNFGQKSGVRPNGRQQANCGTRASRTAPGASEKAEKDSVVGGW